MKHYLLEYDFVGLEWNSFASTRQTIQELGQQLDDGVTARVQLLEERLCDFPDRTDRIADATGWFGEYTSSLDHVVAHQMGQYENGGFSSCRGMVLGPGNRATD